MEDNNSNKNKDKKEITPLRIQQAKDFIWEHLKQYDKDLVIMFVMAGDMPKELFVSEILLHTNITLSLKDKNLHSQSKPLQGQNPS